MQSYLHPRPIQFSNKAQLEMGVVHRLHSTSHGVHHKQELWKERGPRKQGRARVREAGLQVSKGDLWLDHPKLGQMPGSVRVLRPERGSKRVD